MLCPNCSKDIRFLPGTFFWCSECKVYQCRECTRLMTVCPKCKGTIQRPNLWAVGATSFLFFIITTITFFPILFHDLSSMADPSLGRGTSVLMAFPLGSALVFVISLAIFVSRLRAHQNHLMTHPVTRVGPGLQPSMPVNIEWSENVLQPRYRAIAIVSWVLTILLSSTAIGATLGPVPGDPFLIWIFIPLLILVFPVVFAIVFTAFMYRTPTHIGLTEAGLHLRYNTESPAASYPTLIVWEDLITVSGLASPGSDVMEVKTKTGTYYIPLHKDLIKVILDELERNRGRTASGKERTDEEVARPEEIQARKEEALRTGLIEWNRNKVALRILGLGAFISFLGLCIGLVIIVLFGMPDVSEFEVIVHLVLFPLAMGVTLITVSLIMPQSVGFSNAGLHLSYLFRGPRSKRIDFIGWDEVKKVQPVIRRFLTISKRSGEEVLIMNVDIRLLERFTWELDGKYLERHPELRTTGKEGPPKETIHNNARRAIQRYLWISIILFLTSLMLIPIGIVTNDFIIIMMSILIIPFTMVFVLILPMKFYPQMKRAPHSVSFSSQGVHIDYGGPGGPPGTASFIGWKEIDRLEPLGEALPVIVRGGVLNETMNRKYIIMVKKSGISIMLGPIDRAIADRLKERYPYSERDGKK